MNLREREPLLLPRPRTMRRRPGMVDVSPRAVREHTGTAGLAGAREGYTLRIDERDGVVMTAGSADGLRHAQNTLAQLRAQYGKSLPALDIEDAPRFATRGVMLDVSRDRIPTMEELARIVDRLAGLKYNHLQLYTEHTFAYAAHRAAWEGWSPITGPEVRQLDRLCQARGITLAANQNCFGHLSSWLRRPEYAHLAETHGEWVFDVWSRSGPFSLCPIDPASEQFVKELLTELLPCFSKPLVNIGCDETFDVGFGRSKAQVAERGRGAVYAEFVAKVARIALGLGKRPMFWADIALHDPRSLAALPPEMLALAWGYEPDSDFESWCMTLNSAGLETWVCPGTSSWRSITGRTTERRGNVARAAQAGLRHGASGMLICDWGDTGHQQQWPVAWHALACAAESAWNGGELEADPRAVALHGHGDASLKAGAWFDALGDADLAVREVALPLSRPGVNGRLRNQTAIFIDMHTAAEKGLDVGPRERWEDALANIRSARATIPDWPDEHATAEAAFTLDMAEFAAVRAFERRAAGGISTAARNDLRARLDALVPELRRLWLLRSRPGGLDHSCGFLAPLATELGAPPPRA